jgi:FecR protein
MRNLRVVALPLVALFLLLAPYLKADSNVRIVGLSFVQGDVLIDQGTGQGYKRAVMNMPVTSSTLLSTGDDGLAEVQFEDGSTLRLVGNTSVFFRPLSLTAKGERISGMSVREGTVYIHVLNDKHDLFVLKANDLELEVTKGTHLRVSADNAQTVVAVFHGDLTDPTAGLDIGKNQSFQIDNKAKQVTAVAKGIDPFATDAWDTEREKYHQNPAQYPSLATSSIAFAPASAPMLGCNYGMMLGSFGVYSPGCTGFMQGFDPLYAGLGFPIGVDPMMLGYGLGYGYGSGYGYPYGYGYGAYGYGVPTATGLRNAPKPAPTHGRPVMAAAFPRTAVSLSALGRNASLAGMRSGAHASFTPINRGAMANRGMAGSAPAARWRPFTPQSRAAYAPGMPGGASIGRPGMIGGYGADRSMSAPASMPMGRMGSGASAPAPVSRPGRPGR